MLSAFEVSLRVTVAAYPQSAGGRGRAAVVTRDRLETLQI